MIVVIADDITGAAEIAGIGFRFGLKVSLITRLNEIPQCDLLVCATDTRSMSEIAAVTTISELADRLYRHGFTKVFKKTDSVLRGHIIAELKALMAIFGNDRTLLIPENPSRKRIIKDGIYYINNQPLDQTLFAHDPEFPRQTANVKSLLNEEVIVASQPEDIGYKGIFIGEASSINDITAFTSYLDKQTLAAGGADFFVNYLIYQGFKEKDKRIDSNVLKLQNVLIICGSTANNRLTENKYINQNNIPTCSMPIDVFEGKDSGLWIEELSGIYQKHSSLILSINHPSKGGKAFAIRLKEIIGKATIALLAIRYPDELIIEGGATAYAILNMLNWEEFQITNEIEPGLIRMIPHISPGIFVTLKPGSYLWGNDLFR